MEVFLPRSFIVLSEQFQDDVKINLRITHCLPTRKLLVISLRQSGKFIESRRDSQTKLLLPQRTLRTQRTQRTQRKIREWLDKLNGIKNGILKTLLPPLV
jgi:hypothetical protein